jgi:hypothetical protein
VQKSQIFTKFCQGITAAADLIQKAWMEEALTCDDAMGTDKYEVSFDNFEQSYNLLQEFLHDHDLLKGQSVDTGMESGGEGAEGEQQQQQQHEEQDFESPNSGSSVLLSEVAADSMVD